MRRFGRRAGAQRAERTPDAQPSGSLAARTTQLPPPYGGGSGIRAG